MRHLDLLPHCHGLYELKREQINTYEAKNQCVTSEVWPIVLIASGWGRIGRTVHPSWMSPWHTHANISTETQHISSSCITNLLPRKQEDAKKKKKISITFNFETVKKPLKGILKVPEKEMEIGLLITDSQPTPFYSPVILSAHVTVFLPFSVYRGTNARHQ